MSLLLPGKRSAMTPKRYIVRNPLQKSHSDCDSPATLNNQVPDSHRMRSAGTGFINIVSFEKSTDAKMDIIF